MFGEDDESVGVGALEVVVDAEAVGELGEALAVDVDALGDEADSLEAEAGGDVEELFVEMDEAAADFDFADFDDGAAAGLEHAINFPEAI